MSWLGETTPEASQSWVNGYLAGTALFGVALIVLVWLQIRAKRLHPLLYWATIIASTTAGTTLADFATRSLGIGYAGGASLLLTMVLGALAIWYISLGSVAVATVREPKAECFYWLTITFSQTLGTALGDWAADDGGLGFGGGALVFGAALAVLAGLYFWTRANHVFLFGAFIPDARWAIVGDFLDKPMRRAGWPSTAHSPPRCWRGQFWPHPDPAAAPGAGASAPKLPDRGLEHRRLVEYDEMKGIGDRRSTVAALPGRKAGNNCRAARRSAASAGST